MTVLTPGHKYLLSNIKLDNKDVNCNILKFYHEKGKTQEERVGTSNQEVIRALIDRVKFMEEELHHSFNQEIIFHLRKALALHEARHLVRMVDKGIEVENMPIGGDGHYKLLAPQEIKKIKESQDDR